LRRGAPCAPHPLPADPMASTGVPRGGLRCGSDGPDAPGHSPRRREPLSLPAPADLAGTCLLPITGARGSPPARLVDPTSTLDAQPRKRPAPNTHRPEDAPGGCPTPRYPIRGGHLMIRFEEVTFHSAGVEEPALREVTLTVERSEEHTSELQSRFDVVCRLLLDTRK